MTKEELMEKIEKEETWLLYVLLDQPDMASSYSVDIAFDSVKHHIKDYIDSQQKVGRWIQKEEEGDAEPFIIWECSECHCVDEDDKPSYKYCPQCGAKMGVE